MRPARKGPENRRRRERSRGRIRRPFNEAGPQGAGKPPTGRAHACMTVAVLQ